MEVCRGEEKRNCIGIIAVCGISSKVAQKSGFIYYISYNDFGQISSKMTRREFSIFIFFSDAYTCTYVA